MISSWIRPLSGFDALHSFNGWLVEGVQAVKQRVSKRRGTTRLFRGQFRCNPIASQGASRRLRVIRIHGGEGADYGSGHATRTHDVCHQGIPVLDAVDSLV